MTKITITVESSDGLPGAGASAGSTPALAPDTGPPPDVLAQAAATGAINAGPGPRAADISGSVPVASSVSGTAGQSSVNVMSGGAAPQRLFGMQDGSSEGGNQ
jgi:hypothetical protein